jgi:hypothetical protein
MMHRLARLSAVMVVLAGCGTDAATQPDQSVPPTEDVVTQTSTTEDPSTTASTTSTAVSGTSTTTTTASSAKTAGLGVMPNLALVGVDGRVAWVRNGVVSQPVTGLIAANNAMLIETSPSEGTPGATTVVWRSLADGNELAQLEVTGSLTASATDMSGDVVALTRPNPVDPTATEIVIATRQGEAFRRGYDAELLPEGFTNAYNGSLPIGLFVIEYLEPPPADPSAPRPYRVRVLDTATGDLGLPLNLRDKSQQVDEDMLGFSRTHVTSRLNGLLFTLYRGLDDDESGYAFVHTLGFVNGVWCLDLPSELHLEGLPGALALSDHESRLVVASANGYLTDFVIEDITDPAREPVARRTVGAWTPSDSSAPSLSATNDMLLVGQGDTLRWIDATTLTSTRNLSWDMQIEAVLLLDGGDAVAAGTGRLSQISPNGDLVAEVPVPSTFGRVSRIVPLGN